jgi:hypothetical protein
MRNNGGWGIADDELQAMIDEFDLDYDSALQRFQKLLFFKFYFKMI